MVEGEKFVGMNVAFAGVKVCPSAKTMSHLDFHVVSSRVGNHHIAVTGRRLDSQELVQGGGITKMVAHLAKSSPAHALERIEN